ncbi:MAG: hypothetical protein J7578_14880 [Chitinophagaceae bacterium]|nr:hypothetical protein [Chitinophagaceae bacterium]
MESNFTQAPHSYLSFAPLIREWEKMIREGREGTRQLYQDLLNKVRQHPELLGRIEDLSVLDKHKTLIEQMMATVFPVTLNDKEDLFGAGFPFQMKMFYESSKFRELFIVDPHSHDITLPEADACGGGSPRTGKEDCMYQFILNRLYDIDKSETVRMVEPYKCQETGLDRYMELEIDTRFLDVRPIGELPALPENVQFGCVKAGGGFEHPAELKQLLPLDKFEFEGMVIIRIWEVTEREVLNIIRDKLLHLNNFADTALFTELQQQVQNLLGVPGASTAIKPFFQVNGHMVLSEFYTTMTGPQIRRKPSPEKLQYVYQAVTTAFAKNPRPLLVNDINEDTVIRYPFLTFMAEYGWKSAIICPLFGDNQQMMGVLIIVSDTKGKFQPEHVARIEPAIPLFKIAMEKAQENLDHQVDRVIKDQFTAVQDAVEWRFTEAALNYLTGMDKGDGEVKIEPIVFENVYPLYGAIDIRNSSVERNHSIQLDLLEQLNLANDIVLAAKKDHPFPLLDETNFKIRKYIHSVSNILFADDELSILQFLKVEVVQLFKHLQSIMPSLNKPINKYFEAVDSPVEMVYHHRKKYEDSITHINNEVARFIDQEQKQAQHIFPHYFERFVTDGVDFNIYIGQAITPDKKFDFFYLRNLKIWQLSTLAKAARLTHSLEKQLDMPLQTSQLILAHSHPISISFRTAERKFDVDGAYNIRYEIIKKRIDKVHLKDSNERLTKPGYIAIVYSQQQEAFEYLEYIEYLQSQGLLRGEVERLELEELQGVSGLKALRVGVNLEVDSDENGMEKAGRKLADVHK